MAAVQLRRPGLGRRGGRLRGLAGLAARRRRCQLFTTTYGRFLLVKLIIVAAMVAAGAYNQLALTPRIARAHAEGDLGRGFALTLKHFPKVVAVETVLGLAVLTIVPFLSGSARTQAGGPPAPAVDGGVLALGTVLVVMLVASLYASYRVSTMLARRAVEPVAA
nr:CopD family protein [Kutzneria sp. 744]